MVYKMRKDEIKKYVDELVKTPGTDAVGLTLVMVIQPEKT